MEHLITLQAESGNSVWWTLGINLFGPIIIWFGFFPPLMAYHCQPKGHRIFSRTALMGLWLRGHNPVLFVAEISCIRDLNPPFASEELLALVKRGVNAGRVINAIWTAERHGLAITRQEIIDLELRGESATDHVHALHDAKKAQAERDFLASIPKMFEKEPVTPD